MRHRKEVDRADDEGARAVRRLLACAGRPVAYQRGDSAEFPFAAEIDGARWVIRINDFPERALYSLLIDDVEAGDLEDWPEAWRKPV